VRDWTRSTIGAIRTSSPLLLSVSTPPAGRFGHEPTSVRSPSTRHAAPNRLGGGRPPLPRFRAACRVGTGPRRRTQRPTTARNPPPAAGAPGPNSRGPRPDTDAVDKGEHHVAATSSWG